MNSYQQIPLENIRIFNSYKNSYQQLHTVTKKGRYKYVWKKER